MEGEWEQPVIAAVMSQLFRDSPLPIAIYDTQGQVRQANDAHRSFVAVLGEATGIAEQNILSDLASQRFGHRHRFLEALKGVDVDYGFELGGPGGPEESLVPGALDSQRQEFRRFLLPARGEDGEILAVASVIVDVSDWFLAERDRARLQAELMQAQKAESLGLLAGGIAHDFNNLLMSVMGNASLLLEELSAGSGPRRLAEAILLSAQRAADVARQLLAYAGKGRFQVELVDLSELVSGTAEVLRITVASQADLQLELAASRPSVKVDVTQLRQVVMNLITNARDALEDGGRIVVRTGTVPAGAAELEGCHGAPDPAAEEFAFVEVEDTGRGMDADTVSRIFDPFFSTKGGARGLGLSAVVGIVRAHRGALRVVSEPGRGTLMRVLLPAQVHAVPARLHSVRPPAPSQRPQVGGHVLVVDDEEAVRAILARMLRALGYTATVVENGAQAREALAADAVNIACVLLDLTMPGEDGADTFARIREDHPEMPVIFMSGYEAGAVPRSDGFLHKPFTLPGLRKTLSEVLER